MLVSHYPNVSINTANPPTEMARRDAVRRDLFVPITESEKASPDKPAVSDERSRAANSQPAVTLYDAKGKETETQQAIEGRGERQGNEQSNDAEGQREQSSQQDKQQAAEQQQAKRQQAEQEKVEQQEQQQIQELESRDQEVKAHEQAHAAVGGRYAGAPSYSYELGPDGKQYAVGGEVQIDISPIPGDPQATVQKMQQVRAAALAPAEPSAADRRIAAEAMQRQIQAQAELVQQTSAGVSNNQAEPAQSVQQDSNSNADVRVNGGPASGQIFYGPQVQTDISYKVNDDAGGAIVFPQRDTLAVTAQMALRRSVIAGFYQRATEPQIKQSLQQA